ncbi:MAG: DUF4433 domain-containing protein [Clostridiales bacterium]|nr:DUF4433 domain-containing protein [Clostridiales bacterium]
MRIAYEVLLNHNVNRLCHFTRFVTLKHILGSDDGIKARNFVDGLVSRPTDGERFDREEDYICCSVEYPNTWYLDKVRNDDPIFKEWAVLCIDPKALLNATVKYSACNAARECGAYVHDESYAISELYNSRSVLGFERSSDMLKCCPTDGQSEILLYKNIPRQYITGILLRSENAAKQLIVSFKTLEISDTVIPQIWIAPEVFEKKTWSNLARIGKRPEEKIYRRF